MDVRFDLSTVTYPGVLEVVAPIFPGGILAIGTALLNRPFTETLLTYGNLGYRTRILVVIFAVYTAGLLLQLLIGYTSYATGYILGSIFGHKLFKDRPEPWRAQPWRKVARAFIGEDLAPSTDQPYFKNLHEQALQAANEIPDPGARAREQMAVNGRFLPVALADTEWYWWHQILASYFEKPSWHGQPGGYFVAILNSSSWAVIFLMFANQKHHWFPWLLSAMGILFGTLWNWFGVGLYGPDPYGTALTAKILRALKPKAPEVAQAATPPHPERQQ